MLLFLLNTAFAQSLVQGRVINHQQEAVAYATIRLGNTASGTHADAEGNFRLKAKPTDTLYISAVGYRPLEVILPLRNPDIRLAEAISPLPEATVRAKRKKADALNLGNFKNRQDGQFTGYKEAILFIENPKRVPARIKQALLMTSRIRFGRNFEKRLKNKKVLFQLHLYARNPLDGSPAQDLISSEIIGNFEPGKRRLRFSLEEYTYFLPAEGAFLGIEFLGFYQEDHFISFEQISREEWAQFCVAMSDGHPKPQSFVRESFGVEYKAIKIGNPYFNFNLGLEVLY